jgi:hypothetical protein
MRTWKQMAFVVVLLCFGAEGCRQILGVDDLTYDLPPANGGGGTGAQGGATSTTTTAGGGGAGGEGAIGGSGGMPVTCAAADRAATADGVLFWSTLDRLAAVTEPLVGNGPGSIFGGEFVPAQSDQGVRLQDLGDQVRWPVALADPTNLHLAHGAVDLCLRPRVGHTATEAMPIFFVGGGDNQLAVDKTTEGSLVVSWTFVPGSGSYSVGPAAYTLEPESWARLTVTWQFQTVPKAVTVAVDGVLVAGELAGSYPDGTPPNPEVGGVFGSGAEAELGPGVVDELVVYGAPFDVTAD